MPIVACSGGDKKAEIENGASAEPQEPVEDLYNKAADALDSESYLEAKTLFEDVEREYPYSKWATKAKLMAA